MKGTVVESDIFSLLEGIVRLYPVFLTISAVCTDDLQMGHSLNQRPSLFDF
jgi:hypothetical protein